MHYSLRRYLPALSDPVARSFALRLTLASALAMAAANALSLANPWWASMAVWMVGQPTRGLLIERGIAQLTGTFLGAVVAVMVMKVASHDPRLALIIVGAWIAVCCGIGNAMRHQRAYGAVMCGATTAIVVGYCLGTNIDPIEFGTARVTDNAIGILSSVFVVAIWSPVTAADDLVMKARTIAHETMILAARAINGSSTAETIELERRQIVDLAMIEASAEDAAAGSFHFRRRLKTLRGLLASLLDLIAIARTISSRLEREQARGRQEVAAVGDAIEALGEAMRSDDPLPLDSLSFEIETLKLAAASLRAPLGKMESALEGVVNDYREMISNLPGTPLGFSLHHPDLAGMRSAIIRGAVVSAVASAIWSLAPYEPVRYGWVVACAFTTLFALMDEPLAVVPGAALGGVLASGAAFVWRIEVIPLLHDGYVSLLLALPLMLIAALMQASRRTAFIGFAFNMIFAVALAGLSLGQDLVRIGKILDDLPTGMAENVRAALTRLREPACMPSMTSNMLNGLAADVQADFERGSVRGARTCALAQRCRILSRFSSGLLHEGIRLIAHG